MANAENNLDLDPDTLWVKNAYADEGPTLKRIRPRAQGRAYRIRKRTSHITVVVESRPAGRGNAKSKSKKKGLSLVIAPTSVPKVSLGNGLVYAYTKPVRKDGIDAWYFTAIDVRTGKVAWSRLTGTGIQWNNHYASIYLGPDGAAYIATLVGLVRIADG